MNLTNDVFRCSYSAAERKLHVLPKLMFRMALRMSFDFISNKTFLFFSELLPPCLHAKLLLVLLVCFTLMFLH